MRYTCLCMMLAGFAGTVTAADLSVVGTWQRTVDKSDLSAGAGSDLTTEILSLPGVATLSITGATGTHWRVETLRANDTNWPAGVVIAVRSSSATGDVIGGAGYLDVTSTPQTLCEGTGDASVEIQFRVAGATVRTRANLYNLLISYRIVSLP